MYKLEYFLIYFLEKNTLIKKPPGVCQCSKPQDHIMTGKSESIWSNAMSSRTAPLNYYYSLRRALAKHFFLIKYKLTRPS